MPITVAVSAGIVTITALQPDAERPMPPYRETIRVSGGMLAYSLNDLTATPEAVIDDVEAALFWLPQLFGEPVRDLVLELLEGSRHNETGEILGEVQADSRRTSDLSALAGRVCLAEWLLQWWPSRGPGIPVLDVPLLALERSTLKWEAPLLFDEHETSLELEVLVPELGRRMAGLLDGLEEGHEFSQHAPVLWRAAQATTHLLALDTAAFAAVAAACEAYALDPTSADYPDALEEAFIAAYDLADEERASVDRWEHAIATQGDFALTAAEVASDEPHMMLTVDPVQVPARAVGGREDNVALVVDEAANTVTILVDLGDLPLPGLMARVWPHAGLLPRMVPLTITPEGYRGETTLDDLDLDSMDVFDERLVSRPRTPSSIAEDLEFIAHLIRSRIRRAEGLGNVTNEPMGPFAAELPR